MVGKVWAALRAALENDRPAGFSASDGAHLAGDATLAPVFPVQSGCASTDAAHLACTELNLASYCFCLHLSPFV